MAFSLRSQIAVVLLFCGRLLIAKLPIRRDTGVPHDGTGQKGRVENGRDEGGRLCYKLVVFMYDQPT